MDNSKIEVDGETIIISLRNGTQSNQNYTSLKMFYCLSVGSDVFANDSVCYLLRFEDELWLIPEMTKGAAGLRGWFDKLTIDKKVVIASIDYLPMSWRLKLLILPGTEANLKILDLSELNKIETKLVKINNSKIEDFF